MNNLNSLKNCCRPTRNIQRVGRGPGSGRGRTCGRGEKGAGSRSGYKRRFGYEGGQMRLFMKLPQRGFSNVRFRKAYDVINLAQIQAFFNDGDLVNLESLHAKGLIGNSSYGVKILGDGNLTKNVRIEAHSISEGARAKLGEQIQLTVIE